MPKSTLCRVQQFINIASVLIRSTDPMLLSTLVCKSSQSSQLENDKTSLTGFKVAVVKLIKLKHLLLKSKTFPICGTKDGITEIVVVIALVHDDK